MTNEVLECLETRRSVRAYEPRQVEEEKLEAVLKAGTYAASGMGRQAAKIIVLQKPEDIAALERLNAAVIGNPDGHPFYGAPTVLLVLADSAVFTALEDGSLVLGNLMNAAHSLGLGSCWIHRAKQELETPEGRAMLRKWGVPDGYFGVGHLVLGYAAGKTPAAKPRKADFITRV